MKVLSPSDLKCPITHKTAYASRSGAEKVVERARIDPHWKNKRPTTVYRCSHCHWWHLGGRKRNVRAHSS